MKSLVLGCGSIGRRHLANLRQMGLTELAACDPRPEALDRVRRELGVEELYSDAEEALRAVSSGSVFICSPTALHLEQLRQAVEAGCHVYVEKPLAHLLDGLEELLARAEGEGLVVVCGYNQRYNEGINRLKALLAEGSLGRLWTFHIQVGEFLPERHPGTDYRQEYAAQRALGGGVILDASHEIDYARYLFGEVAEVFCASGKVSDLEIDTEDVAEIILRFQSGLLGHVHLDYLQRAKQRECEVVAEKGTASLDLIRQEIRVYVVGQDGWQMSPYEQSPGQTYCEAVSDFFRAIHGKSAPRSTGRDALSTLRVTLACNLSSERRATVRAQEVG